MNKHSDICPTSATDDEYDCVCVYIESERERIIALLEAQARELFKLSNDSEKKKDRRKLSESGRELSNAIALIKGEQK